METILSILQFIWTIFLVLLIFNLIIVVHELGHYWAALWRGLKVDKFQIWFGKPIWKKKINGVQWGLGSIPAGGFVALPQMAPMAMLEGAREDGEEPLPPISPLDKIIVAFAGPLFSFGLAVVFAILVSLIGYPVLKGTEGTQIGLVVPESPAEKAGLKPGDTIKTIDGAEVDSFGGMVGGITWAIVAAEEDIVDFVIDRDGSELKIPVEIAIPEDTRKWWQKLFVRPAFRRAGIGPVISPIIADAPKTHSPAEYGGLKEGDKITHLNGQYLYNFNHLQLWQMANTPESVVLTVERDDKSIDLQMKPRVPEILGGHDPADVGPRLGFELMSDEERQKLEDYDSLIVTKRPGVVEQIVGTVQTMAATLKAVFSPKSKISTGHLNGGLGIIHYYYIMLNQPEGWKLVLWFSVLLNINLAILNMLPIPVLDGGHIVMSIIEGFLKIPINLRALEILNTACALLLIGFMLHVTGFDIGDFFKVGGSSGGEIGFEELQEGG